MLKGVLTGFFLIQDIPNTQRYLEIDLHTHLKMNYFHLFCLFLFHKYHLSILLLTKYDFSCPIKLGELLFFCHKFVMQIRKFYAWGH